MLIGIDASRYSREQKTGVEFYSKEIIDGLVKKACLPTRQGRAGPPTGRADRPCLPAGRQKRHRLILYSPQKLEIKGENVQIKVMPFRRLWTQVRLSLEMLWGAPEVLFVPSHTLPLIHPQKSVITIHDVAFSYFRRAYSPFQFWYLKWSTKFAVKHAFKIIVPSQATKKDLIKFFRCPEEKIKVIYHGLPQKPVLKISAEKEQKILRKFGLKKGDPFFLFIGRLEIKKNLIHLIQAFFAFSQEFPNFKLILAGNRGVGFRKILQITDQLKLSNKVLMPGYIDEEEKEVLFQNCRAFTFPSFYEGFGFPILEAFSYQVPVLTSNSSALLETAGEAAFLVTPFSSNQIAEGLKKLASSENLKEELVQKGRAQLKKFSWEKTIEKTWNTLI